MSGKSKSIAKPIIMGSLITLISTSLILFLFPFLTSHFELKINDLKFNLRKVFNQEPSINSSIVLVKLDDESKKESKLGLWPYSHYTKVLKKIVNGNPTSVGMDFMFTVSIDTLGWEDLVNVMFDSGITVNPYLVEYGDNNDILNIYKHHTIIEALEFEELPEISPGIAQHVIDIPYKTGGVKTDFVDASLSMGIVNLQPDIDGMLRRIPIVSEVNGMLAPHLFLSLLANHLSYELKNMELVSKRLLILHDFPIKGAPVDLKIPLDGNGNMIINYLSLDKVEKQIQAGLFNVLSAWKIYKSKMSPNLNGRTVLFGDHSAAGKDFNPTPIDGFIPNPLVFVMAMSNILDQSFIYPTNLKTNLLIVVLMLTVLLLFGRFTNILWYSISLLGVLLLFIIINFYLFIYFGIDIALINILIIVSSVGVFSLIYLIYETQVSVGILEGSLQSYLSPHLMDKIKNDPDMLKLGGERKRISVLFSDIVQFTKFTDEADPAEVQNVLEEYFSKMATVVFSNGGIIDKYMGDGILAFFENPKDGVTSAQAALKTAMDMQTQAIDLNKKYMDENRFPFSIRVAVSTGYAKVGNIGPKEKIDYTIIGSVVNRGARLDGIGDPGDTVIDEDTYFFVKDDYHFEDLGLQNLKGFEKPVQVYKVDQKI